MAKLISKLWIKMQSLYPPWENQNLIFLSDPTDINKYYKSFEKSI
jgi:hypothetical protein